MVKNLSLLPKKVYKFTLRECESSGFQRIVHFLLWDVMLWENNQGWGGVSGYCHLERDDFPVAVRLKEFCW